MKRGKVIPCLLLVIPLSVLLFTSLVQSEMTEAEADAILDAMHKARVTPTVKGRSSGRPRPKLPTNIWDKNPRQPQMECGKSYGMFEQGNLQFTINSPGSECKYNFEGSRRDSCQVAILCKEPLGLGSGQYLKVSDATVGLLEATGDFDFGNRPYVSLNKGASLYVSFKGQSSAQCLVYCNSNIDKSSNIGKARKIPRSSVPPPFTVGSCTCGKISNLGRVVNGEAAMKFEFPWLAAMVFKNPVKGNRLPVCGSSLISDSYVVTAAHCMFHPPNETPEKASDLQFLLHAHVLGKRENIKPPPHIVEKIPGWNLPIETDSSENSIRLDVEKIIVHPFYNPKTFDFDIAIVKLKQKVPLQPGKASTVCLPYLNENLPTGKGVEMLLAGWGHPSEQIPVSARLLQKLHLPLVDFNDCLKVTLPTKRHICAGVPQGGIDACQGDSGGPFIRKINEAKNQYALGGVVSSGDGCARAQKPGLYTDVQETVQWIYHTIGEGPSTICPR